MTTFEADRRTVLKASGASLAAVLIAGCSGDDDDDDGDDDGVDDNGDAGAIDIDPDEEIVLEGITGGWVGIAPSQIEGEENPTLGLQEGETYSIDWEQGDGSQHNIEIWDADGDVVGDYATDLTGSPEDDDPLEFEVSGEMAIVRCQPHPAMEAPIEVQ
ncbi:twin-arginine translocation signal domain-containing protein [Halovivax sp.]|uniref:twin-arginine translocation signal domain-containing protein n=1 Tax=Halovivax sp. TaxID=1935978 RepID=UPI0025C31D3E|nr:twin-arginine translocation signal domain-containing protein [Halovivax sp.]